MCVMSYLHRLTKCLAVVSMSVEMWEYMIYSTRTHIETSGVAYDRRVVGG